MKQAILIGIAVWFAVFTASLAAYAVVYESEPVPASEVWLPEVTPSPWVIS